MHFIKNKNTNKTHSMDAALVKINNRIDLVEKKGACHTSIR